MARRAYKEDAMIIYLKLEKKVDDVKAFLESLEYACVIKSYKKITKENLIGIDLIVFVTPEDYPVEGSVEIFQETLLKAWASGASIIGLGDVNSKIVSTLGYEVLYLDNHTLEEGQLHNIVDVNNEEYFIPSKHITSIKLKDYDFFDILDSKKSKDSVLSIVAVSPDRGTKKELSSEGEVGIELPEDISYPEVEIFIMPSFRYLGIYGAPESFFTEGTSNKTSKNTLAFIELLISEL